MKTEKSEIEKGRVEMNIHILWNECVDKTTDISSCIELYTKRIIKEKNSFIQGQIEALEFVLSEGFELGDSTDKTILEKHIASLRKESEDLL